MQYMSVTEASVKWNISPRQVQRLLAGHRIPCAKKYGRSWMIPADAKKPSNPRKEKNLPELSLELTRLFTATYMPLPAHDPDAILKTVKEEKIRLQYESELAYLRGDFERIMRCYDKTEGDDAARLRVSMAAVVAAISLGDYPAYLKIETYLKCFIDAGRSSDGFAVAELVLACVAVSVIAPDMVPQWLSEGDFSAFPPQVELTCILYFRSKYFMCIGKYEIALAVAQTALAFCARQGGITVYGIYLRVVCALACHSLGRENEARHWLLDAMGIALPHGFITPFAENISNFCGLVERCLEDAFPFCRDAVTEQWKRTTKNWITFHNYFARDNIQSVLSLRECHLARLVASRVPYAKIAKQFNISVGRLKNIMLEIYEKLYISSRDELAQYVLMPYKGNGP